MIDPITQYILNEGYMLSDKTISVNLSKFESGEVNKLLVVGVCGSGKTTLAEYLAKKYKAKLVSDTSWVNFRKALDSKDRVILEGAGLASLYYKEDTWKKELIKIPMILIGMSAIKAGMRADKRDGTVPGQAKNWRDIYYFIRTNLTYFQKRLNKMRKDALAIPGADIKEFKLPAEVLNTKPVYN